MSGTYRHEVDVFCRRIHNLRSVAEVVSDVGQGLGVNTVFTVYARWSLKKKYVASETLLVF